MRQLERSVSKILAANTALPEAIKCAFHVTQKSSRLSTR
jgi:hypothetical protein